MDASLELFIFAILLIAMGLVSVSMMFFHAIRQQLVE